MKRSDVVQNLPLAGLRIISFEQFGAAPYATMFLADFGAEVLKVESAEGDFARSTAPLTLGDGDSLYFQCLNLNKKSIFIDLKNAEDRAFFHDLVKTSHAVINNLRGSVPASLGLDYASLAAINPAIACGHISAYGRTNTRADRPGFDFLMQAEAGLMTLTGEPGSPPTRIGVSMIDYMSGMMLAFGIVSMMRSAEKTGRGGDVDACLFDTALHQLGYQGTWYLNENIVTSRAPRSAHPSNTPVQLYKTADGWVYVAAMNEKFWQLLLEKLDRSDLRDDVRFASSAARLQHRAHLTTVLDDVFSKRRTSEWVDLLGAEIPIGPVHELDEALNSSFVKDTAMIAEIAHPKRARIKVLANPLRIDGRRLPQKAGPRLGEHTSEIKEDVRRRLAPV